MRIRFGVVLLAVLAALLPASATAAVPDGPRGPAFYAPPGDLADARPGTAIWQAPYAGTVAIAGARNTKFLYTQTGVAGDPVATSGYVAVPTGLPPAGGWPVVAWAHGTTGLADHCAPTRDDNEEDAATHGPLLARWVAAGYAVVRTDYEGLGTPGRHPYLNGRSEGYAVLDSVRAARRVEPSLGRRVVVAGHSQGGHAALWAGALAPSYAPGLAVRGVLAMAPPSQLTDLFDLMTSVGGGGGLSSTLALFLRGVEAARPGLDLSSSLTPAARKVWPQTLRRCKPGLALAGSFGSVPSSSVLDRGADLGVVRHVLRRNDPRGLHLGVPVLVVQGASDTTVFPTFSERLVDRLRWHGAVVDYRTYAGATHSTVPAASADDTTAFLARVFAG